MSRGPDLQVTKNLVSPEIRTNDINQERPVTNELTVAVTRHNEVPKSVTHHSYVRPRIQHNDVRPKIQHSDVTRLAQSRTGTIRPPPRPFRPSAFHFHFSEPDKKFGFESDDEKPKADRDTGILSKLEDMFDYLRSIGTPEVCLGRSNV